MNLHKSNILKVINNLKSKIVENTRPSYLLVPLTVQGEIDRTKYKGRGRPRKDDYERIDFLKTVHKFTQSIKTNGTT